MREEFRVRQSRIYTRDARYEIEHLTRDVFALSQDEDLFHRLVDSYMIYFSHSTDIPEMVRYKIESPISMEYLWYLYIKSPSTGENFAKAFTITELKKIHDTFKDRFINNVASDNPAMNLISHLCYGTDFDDSYIKNYIKNYIEKKRTFPIFTLNYISQKFTESAMELIKQRLEYNLGSYKAYCDIHGYDSFIATFEFSSLYPSIKFSITKN